MKEGTKILLTLLILSVLTVSLAFIFEQSRMEDKKINVEEGDVYQGPVRPIDDENYFRKTGITRPLIPID